MNLPSALRFPRPGFWALHALLVPAVFAAGVGLGVFHATGHGGAGHDAHGAHPAAPPPPVTDSPLRDEMADLQVAFDALNRAVILGETAGVTEAFHKVHARKQATAAALQSGALRPPKNGDDVAGFIAQDEAFHALIEATVQAADRGDLPALSERADALRDGCVACHTRYR